MKALLTKYLIIFLVIIFLTDFKYYRGDFIFIEYIIICLFLASILLNYIFPNIKLKKFVFFYFLTTIVFLLFNFQELGCESCMPRLYFLINNKKLLNMFCNKYSFFVSLNLILFICSVSLFFINTFLIIKSQMKNRLLV